jgi:hypothetical protein
VRLSRHGKHLFRNMHGRDPQNPDQCWPRRPDLLRLGTVDDSTTTGGSRIIHDDRHVMPV